MRHFSENQQKSLPFSPDTKFKSSKFHISFQNCSALVGNDGKLIRKIEKGFQHSSNFHSQFKHFFFIFKQSSLIINTNFYYLINTCGPISFNRLTWNFHLQKEEETKNFWHIKMISSHLSLGITSDQNLSKKKWKIKQLSMNQRLFDVSFLCRPAT